MDLNKVKRSMTGYLDELSQVPQALERLCRFVEVDGKLLFSEVASHIRNSPETFVFGMASSQWASWPMVFGLEHIGMKIHWMSAYQGLQIPSSRISKQSLVILVSQSGETIEIQRLLERMRKRPDRPLIVGVTNSLTSSLAVQADIVLDVLAGPEHHAPSKTYVNTLATLVVLYSFVFGSDSGYPKDLVGLLLDVASHIASCRDVWKSWGEKVAGSWSKHRGSIQFLAIGPQMASAWQASMLCSETARTFSAVGDWATFRHGFEPQVNKSFTSIGFKPFRSGTDIWHTTTKSIIDRGGRVFLVPDLLGENTMQFRRQGSFDRDLISPIWETLPIHCFCIDLARRKGLDASQIERKVTLDL